MADTIVDIPGVGHVAFPDGMSHDQIGEAIRTKILPQAQGRAQPVAEPSPQAMAPTGGGASAATEPDVAPVAPTIGERISRQANLGTRAVGRGLADVAGAPVDLTTAVLNTVGSGTNLAGRAVGLDPGIKSIQQPLGGSESIKDVIGRLADVIGVPAAPPEVTQTPAEKLMGHVNENTTGFVAPAMALWKGAQTALKSGQAVETMNPLMKPYGEAIKTSEEMAPGVKSAYAAARPVAVDAAAGVGAGVGQDLAPDTPLGRLVGTIAGGVGGASAFNAATAPAALLNTLKNFVMKDPGLAEEGINASRRIGNLSAKTIQGATAEPAEAATAIRTKEQQYLDAGITPPTVALMSEDPGLIGLEKGLRNTGAAPQFAAADAKTRGSAAETLSDLKPEADPRIATDVADIAAANKRELAQRGVDTAETGAAKTAAEAAALRNNVATDLSKEGAASTAIDKTVRGTLDEQRSIKNDLYGQAKDAGAAVSRDVAPFQAAVDEVRSAASTLAPDSAILPKDFFAKIDEATKSAAPQKTETGLLDAEGKPIVREQPGENPSYRDIAGLRPALSDAIAKARAENQGAMVESLSKLKAEVENESTRIAADAAKPGATQEVKDLAIKLDAAGKNYELTYAPNFVKGEGGKLRQDIARDSTGTATKPEDTAKRFLSSKEGAEDLARIVELAGSPKEAQQGVRDYLFAQVARTTLDGDKVNPQRLNRWMALNKDVIEAHPEVAKELRDLQARVGTNNIRGSAAEAQLAKAKAGLGATEKDIEQSGLGLMLGKDPANAVETVMKSNDPERSMASITKQMGGKDSKSPTAQSWKRAVADWVESKVTNQNPASTNTGENPVSLAKLAKVEDRYDRALSQVFTPTEMNSMQMVRKAVTDLSRLNGVRATAGSNTAEDVQRGLNLTEMIAKAHMGQLKGGGFTRTAKLVLGNLGLMNEGAKVSDVLARAMRDPALAAHLLERPVAQADRSLWNSRLNQLMGVASTQRGKEEE